MHFRCSHGIMSRPRMIQFSPFFHHNPGGNRYLLALQHNSGIKTGSTLLGHTTHLELWPIFFRSSLPAPGICFDLNRTFGFPRPTTDLVPLLHHPIAAFVACAAGNLPMITGEGSRFTEPFTRKSQNTVTITGEPRGEIDFSEKSCIVEVQIYTVRHSTTAS